MTPLAVRASKAASLFDLPVARFKRMVAAGDMPQPVQIGGEARWRVDDLQAILDGKRAVPEEEGLEL